MKLKRMYHPILRTEKTAGNEIGIFVVSTYNTDYVLVKEENFERAMVVLMQAGYMVV